MKIPFGDLLIFLFFLIGVTFCGVSYNIYRNEANLIENGIKVKGVVIAMHRMKRLEYPVAPSVRYFTLDGKEHVFHSSDGRNPPLYYVGQEVTLHYNPNDPDEVQLENDHLLVYVFGGFGLVFLLFSVWGIGGSMIAIGKWILRRS